MFLEIFEFIAFLRLSCRKFTMLSNVCIGFGTKKILMALKDDNKKWGGWLSFRRATDEPIPGNVREHCSLI